MAYAQARREEVARGSRRVPSTLHVTSGDSAAGTIGEIGIGGRVLAWRDVLHEGPVPAGPTADLRAARARFLAEWSGADAEETRQELERRDAELTGRHERYVLWFEADLYDQLQLLQVLDALAEAAVAPERIELVSAGEFPGVAHFGGLGELPADALAGLYAQRVALDLRRSRSRIAPGGLPRVRPDRSGRAGRASASGSCASSARRSRACCRNTPGRATASR